MYRSLEARFSVGALDAILLGWDINADDSTSADAKAAATNADDLEYLHVCSACGQNHLTEDHDSVTPATPGNDVIDGTSGDDAINALAGNDIVNGSAGNDTIDGGAGFDRVRYLEADGTEIITTNFFSAFINGTVAAITGMTDSDARFGSDTYTDIEMAYSQDVSGRFINFARIGTNATGVLDLSGLDFTSQDTVASRADIFLGDNDDTLIAGSATNTQAYLGDGNDTATGGSGFLTVFDGDGDDTLIAGTGGANFIAGAGADNYTATAGFGIVNYQYSQTGVNVDLLNGTGRGGFAQGDVYTDIDAVIGTQTDDVFTGSDRSEFFIGLGGFDIVNAGGGDDTISVSDGNDLLSGGSGNDRFQLFNSAATLSGEISDFEEGDRIEVYRLTLPSRDVVLPAWIGTDTFSGMGVAELRYWFDAGVTILEVDADGDGQGDGSVVLSNGEHNLRQYDIIEGRYYLEIDDTATDDYAGDTSTTGQISNGGRVTGTIETAFDSDWFVIEMVAGETYVIDLFSDANRASPLSDTFLRLRDANGELITSNNNFDGTNSQITYTALADGTFYIDAQGFGANTGAYVLQVNRDGTDGDDYTGDATTTGTVTPGVAVTGTIETSGDSDWFAIEMVAGATYVIDLFGDANSDNTLSDTYLYLRDANGNLIISNDDFNGLNSQLTFTALEGGTYYIDAQAYGSNIGDYVLEVEETLPEPFDPDAATNVAIGASASGTISVNGETDYFAIEVEAGESYTIFLIRDEVDGFDPLDNPSLALFMANGSLVTANDDVATFDWNSRIDFTATQTGTLYLRASASDDPNANLNNYMTVDPTGGYTLYVERSDERADFSASEVGDFLTTGFSPLVSRWTSNTITYDISDLPGPAQTLALLAMQAWADLTPLTFVEAEEGETANLVFIDDVLGRAYATSLGPFNNQVTINIASNWSGGLARNPDGSLDEDPFANVDDYTYQTYLHEVGHALGLGHGGAYNAGSGNPISYQDSRLYNQDNWLFSLMSYFSQSTAGVGNYRFTLTPMIADILAVQSLYGANTTTRNGDTTYGFNSTETGSVYDFDMFSDAPPALTLYDTGGEDTLDVSQYSGNQTLNLGEGESSTLGRLSGTGTLTNVLTIAFGTEIENAIGGSGNDMITGNALDNRLFGRNGQDEIHGGDGNDVIRGEAGDDTLRGQDGDDNLGGGDGVDTIFGGNGNDTIAGGDGNDIIRGDAGNDRLLGQDGEDNIVGGDGVDTIFGGNDDDVIAGGNDGDILRGDAGNDTIRGQAGDDDIAGGEGNDRLFGDDGNDTIQGGNGDDVIRGQAGDDILHGQAGADNIVGGDGIDSIFGGDDNDVIAGGADNDILRGGDGNDTLRGDAGNDSVAGGDGNDDLFGGDDNDTIAGGNGHDELFGENGNDSLNGGAGNDTLDGGAGRNWLTGGDGADVFMRTVDGLDIIRDFTVNEDRIMIDDDYADFATLKASMIERPDGVWVDNGDAGAFLLLGIDMDDLDADDFIFVDPGLA